MPAGDAGRDQAGEGAPSARQLLHWATGDRDAEADALADDAGGDVSEQDAKRAVQRAHGDAGYEASDTSGDVATPADVQHERDR
jgi:hypothetical protein